MLLLNSMEGTWPRFRLFLVLALFLCFGANSLPSSTKNGAATQRAHNLSGAGHDELGVVQMDNSAPLGVVWVVQMSDIHLSKWVPARGRALRKSLGHALKLIKPAIVLVTGDLTDAKSEDGKSAQQEEVEWIEYRDSFQKVADESGISLKYFYDIRGNHDKYGVPPSSSLDYFSKYSISAAMNRTGLLQSVTVKSRDGRNHLFVGFDDSMHVGLRAPTNLFGHATDNILVQLDEELQRWDNLSTLDPVTKIVYGHYPMSFTTSTETGKRPEDTMTKNGVAAYICGHLHTTFGRRLYKHHERENGDFWEWEMGDWRVSRMMRVMAVDHGHTSFVDIELIPPGDTAEGMFIMPTTILQTYPLDSTFMLKTSVKDFEDSYSLLNSIRALVFSEETPASVKARIYDFSSHSPILVHESSMNLSEEGSGHGAQYYTTLWEREKYIRNNGLKYAIQIVAESSNGSLSLSEMRFVSAIDDPGKFYLSVLAFIVMGFKWETAFPVFLWSMVFSLLSILVASKVFHFLLEKNGQYEEWTASVFRPSSTTSGALGKVVKVPFWVFLEFSRNNSLWIGLVVCVSYLIFFPWYSGRVLASDFPTGHMSLHGVTVKPSNADSVQTISGLGIPDIMTVVLPYFYGVVLPLLLMISALSAERATCEYHMKCLGKSLNSKEHPDRGESETERNFEDVGAQEKTSSTEAMVQGSFTKDSTSRRLGESDPLLSNTEAVKKDHDCKLSSRRVRKGLFVGCLAVLFIHWRLCMVIVRAYGPMPLVTGLVFSWGAPILLILSIYHTSSIRCRPLGYES